MTRILCLTLLLIAADACHGADRVTYSIAELQVSGKNNVTDIVAQFVEDTDRAGPVESDQLMFLADGQAVSSLDVFLPEADRVEVMSDGAYIVVNVVMEPESEAR